MALSLSHPGVYIEEVSSGVRTIQGVATSIALFVGWAPKGSTTKPVRIGSFADYAREFGDLHPQSFLGYAVMQFFANGGQDAYVIRLKAAAAAAGSWTVPSGNLSFEATSEGAWANAFSIQTKLGPTTNRFRIDVLSGGAVVESFTDLSMLASDPRFPPKVINGRSGIITAAATNLATQPVEGTFSSTSGKDGAVLDPSSPDFKSALGQKFTTDRIDDQIPLFNLMCVPGLTDASVLQVLQERCKERRAFLIVDCPNEKKVSEMEAQGTTGLTGVNAPYSAIFYPWVRAPDPQSSGMLRDFPPCGFVAGIMARTDSARGVWKAPAGTEATLNGAVGLERTLSDYDNGRLNPRGINCLRTFPVYGTVLWGARTLHGDNDRGSEWKYTPVRRLALFLEESLYRGTQWVVFEPNDEPLWAQIRLNVGAFMNDLFRQGAFQGATPREAYFVRCDRTTTTQTNINSGIVNIHVGFAPLKPAEFVVLRIQQMAGEIST